MRLNYSNRTVLGLVAKRTDDDILNELKSELIDCNFCGMMDF